MFSFTHFLKLIDDRLNEKSTPSSKLHLAKVSTRMKIMTLFSLYSSFVFCASGNKIEDMNNYDVAKVTGFLLLFSMVSCVRFCSATSANITSNICSRAAGVLFNIEWWRVCWESWHRHYVYFFGKKSL